MKNLIYPQILTFCEARLSEFDQISEERKAILQKIAAYIRAKQEANQPIQLVYICTHNSRRSHFGQIWSAVAAAYFDFQTVLTYSGGTEETRVHPNVVASLVRTGFEISTDQDPTNPLYDVVFGAGLSTPCFSKVYDDSSNPQNAFAAIMVCTDAEENCPFIPNAEMRISTTYDDPKAFDNTPQQDEQYDERSKLIVREILYMFSLV
jgi:arsenate reductase (thioredoxin)